MECMREDPKAVMHACDIIADDEIALIRALIQEAGWMESSIVYKMPK